MIPLLLIGALVATSISWALWPYTQDEIQTWVYGFLWTALLAVALAVPNVWVALIIAWGALSVPWTGLGLRWGFVQSVGASEVQAATQFNLLVGAGLYLALTRVLQPPDASWWAAGLVGWGLVNAGASCWGQVTGRHGVLWERSEGIQGQPGYTQSTFFNGWLAAMAMLAALHLSMTVSWWCALAALPLAVTLRLAQSWAGLLALAGGGMAYGWMVWPSMRWIGVLMVPLVAAVYGLTVRSGASLGDRLKRVWPQVWAMCRRAHWWGEGIGARRVIEKKPYVAKGSQYMYRHPHNEYLHALLTLGPVPVVCWIGLLLSWAWAPPVLPHRQFAVSLVASLSAYALVYFPLHVPGQAMVLVTALAFAEV